MLMITRYVIYASISLHIFTFIFHLFYIGTPKHIVNFTLKLNPFAAKMLMINRYFDISAAERDLKYKPLIEFDQVHIYEYVYMNVCIYMYIYVHKHI
jgi:hypothetical protein